MYSKCFCFVSVGCPYMAINVSVQHKGGLLILFSQYYYHRGTPQMPRRCFAFAAYDPI